VRKPRCLLSRNWVEFGKSGGGDSNFRKRSIANIKFISSRKCGRLRLGRGSATAVARPRKRISEVTLGGRMGQGASKRSWNMQSKYVRRQSADTERKLFEWHPVSRLVVSVVGSEVVAAVVMQGSVLCVTIPCSPLKVNRNFQVTCRLHVQGRRIVEARNQRGRGRQAEQFASQHFGFHRKLEVWNHGAESFLRSQQLQNHSGNFRIL
jgi:hypothetical protein